MIGYLRDGPRRALRLGLPAHPSAGWFAPQLVGADASHAWVAVFVPELGWVEFDPTNNCLADQHYLLVGWGRDFGDVSPIKGVIQGSGEHELAVAVGVTVTPLDEM